MPNTPRYFATPSSALRLSFDRAGAKSFRAALDAKLADLSRELGIVVTSERMTFSPDTRRFTVKIEAKDGENTDRIAFAQVADIFGLDAEDFGKTYAGLPIVSVTSHGRVGVRRGDGTVGLYPVRVLPKIVNALHPGDAVRVRHACISAGVTPPEWAMTTKVEPAPGPATCTFPGCTSPRTPVSTHLCAEHLAATFQPIKR